MALHHRNWYYYFLAYFARGRDARFQGVTFGGLLIITYTMLGTGAHKPFYYQPVFFFLGGAFYSAVSLFLLYQKPWRILQEQVAFGYEKLAEYFNNKSKLFPSLPEDQEKIRNELALLNIEVFQQIEQIKKIYTALPMSLRQNLCTESMFLSKMVYAPNVARACDFEPRPV